MMNPATKKLSILVLAAEIGDMIKDQGRSKEVEEAAHFMKVASALVLAQTKIKIDKSRTRQVQNEITSIYKDGEAFDVLEALSFVFLGLQDLALYGRNKEVFQPLENAALHFMKVFDPNLEYEEVHGKATEKYGYWTANCN